MRRRYKIIISLAAGLLLAGAFIWWAQTVNFQVLNPQGQVADKQRSLLIFATALSLLVVVPVFGLLAFISIRYREGNRKVQLYRPTWDHSNVAETIWWGLPAILIAILSVAIWTSSHDLDPYKPLASTTPPVRVQVVALQWRWLFIYPDENIATINDLTFPVNTPLNLTITADAPMNSLWIPQLGGQVYAMNGMSTKLHLMADNEGHFNGSSANISGKGFSKMKFVATSTSESSYKEWTKQMKKGQPLDWGSYEKLAEASENTNKAGYALMDSTLYDKIVEKYMPMHVNEQHMMAHSE